MKLNVLGLIGLGLAAVAMIAGKIGLGVILLLVGAAAVFFHYATMMRGMGMDPNQGTISGLGGQGKQQSETVRAAMPEPGEKSPAIWDTMTGSGE